MTIRRLPVAAFAALLSILPPPAKAESAAETLEQFGFFGEWAIQCGHPASANNVVRRTYISATGEAGFVETLGPQATTRNVYRILGVQGAGEDAIAIDIELNDAIRQRLTMRREGERIRTLRNELPDGRVLVDGGQIVANGARTPWLTLCAKTP